MTKNSGGKNESVVAIFREIVFHKEIVFHLASKNVKKSPWPYAMGFSVVSSLHVL